MRFRSFVEFSPSHHPLKTNPAISGWIWEHNLVVVLLEPRLQNNPASDKLDVILQGCPLGIDAQVGVWHNCSVEWHINTLRALIPPGEVVPFLCWVAKVNVCTAVHLLSANVHTCYVHCKGVHGIISFCVNSHILTIYFNCGHIVYEAFVIIPPFKMCGQFY